MKAIVCSYEALMMYFDDQADKEVGVEGIAKRLKMEFDLLNKIKPRAVTDLGPAPSSNWSDHVQIPE